MSSDSSTDPSFETHTHRCNQRDDNKNMHGSLTPSSPRSLLQLNHSHAVKLTRDVFNICDNRVFLLWSRAKVGIKATPGGPFFHVCAFWVSGAFAASPFPHPWKWGRSDQAEFISKQTASGLPPHTHSNTSRQAFRSGNQKAVELLKHDIPKKGPLDPKSTKRHPTWLSAAGMTEPPGSVMKVS